MIDLNRMERPELESLVAAVGTALVEVRAAEKRDVVLEAELYAPEPGQWEFALRLPRQEAPDAEAPPAEIGGERPAEQGALPELETTLGLSSLTGVTFSAGQPRQWTRADDLHLLQAKVSGHPIDQIAAALDTDRKHVLERWKQITDGGRITPQDALAAIRAGAP
jgi:hypothetical protein